MISDKTKAAVFAILIVILGVTSNSFSNEKKSIKPSNLDKISIELEKIKKLIETVQSLLREEKNNSTNNTQTINVGTALDGYITEYKQKRIENEKDTKKN